MRWILGALGMPPSRTFVDVGADTVHVQAWFWFRVDVPRERLLDAVRVDRRVVSRGVHGWRGSWLVNAASDGLVRLTIEPGQRGWLTVVPLTVRELTVSVVDPDGLVQTLASTQERW